MRKYEEISMFKKSNWEREKKNISVKKLNKKVRRKIKTIEEKN